MKVLIIIITLIIGFTLGYNKPERYFKKEIIVEKQASCRNKKAFANEKKENSFQELSGCLFTFPNKGTSFDLSSTQASSRVRSLFAPKVSEEYESPNEFNVNTNDSPFGESAQKNDPRDGLLVRFKIDKKRKNDKKVGFSSDILSLRKSPMGCDPSLYILKGKERADFLKAVVDKEIDIRETKLSDRRFTFFNLARLLFKYIGSSRMLDRYKIFGNSCTKGVSIPLNFCYANPTYDLQLNDVFISESGTRAIEKVYCKRTAEEKWVLQYATEISISN